MTDQVLLSHESKGYNLRSAAPSPISSSKTFQWPNTDAVAAVAKRKPPKPPRLTMPLSSLVTKPKEVIVHDEFDMYLASPVKEEDSRVIK